VDTLTFGIFDHIEDIPGTPTHRLLQDRLDLIRFADEAGFSAFHLAEHHGSELCMAPNQELVIAAASQVTTNIRLGPMVKLLPLHHPVRIVEDMCVADQLSGGRLDFGVGSGVAPIEHAWFGSDWKERRERSRAKAASTTTSPPLPSRRSRSRIRSPSGTPGTRSRRVATE
jgi:alkanesulfonate monooxygenase SsuD/methylene tetrahydromethanopterin reductase-like flavin-dependent oxidoreductase (luciferase family)